MTLPIRWGALAAASFAAALPIACEPRPPAVPSTPPPPAETRPVASVQAPAEPRVKLTALTPLLAANEGDSPKPMMGLAVGGSRREGGIVTRRRTPYGRGTFTLMTYRRWSHAPPECPVIRGEGCSSFTVSTSDKSPDEGAWLRGDLEAAQAQKESAVQPVEREWVDLSGGRDGVYGLRNDGKVDFISDQGKVSIFAESDEMKGWRELWVLEVGEHTYLAGSSSGREARWSYAEAVASKEGPRKMGPFRAMPMAPTPEFRANAQGARMVAHEEQMAMFGAPQIYRLPDEGDKKDRWAMAWLEVVPPPYGWPAGKPQPPGGAKAKGESKPAPKAGGKRGGKNGCGGPPSRGFDDKSVLKRAHVTVFAGDAIVDDKIAWTSSDMNPYATRLQAAVEKDKVTIKPPAKPRKGDSPAPRPRRGMNEDSEALAMSPHEVVEAAGFDEVSGEGLAVISSGGVVMTRRFDAEGKPLGEPAPFNQKLPDSLHSLSRAGGHWYAISSYPALLVRLTGDAKPFELPQHHRVFGLAAEGNKAQLFSAREGAVWRTTINENNEREGDPVKLAQLPEKASEHTTFLVRHKGGLSLVSLEEGRGDDGSFRVFMAPAAEGATWSTEKPPSNEFYPYNGHIRQLAGEPVLTFHEGQRSLSLWLNSKTWIDADLGGYMRGPQFERAQGALIFVQQGDYGLRGESPRQLPMLLSTAPGKPTEAPDLAFAHDGCSHSFATSATTVVLVCAEAVDKLKPGVRVGLRTFHRDL